MKNSKNWEGWGGGVKGCLDFLPKSITFWEDIYVPKNNSINVLVPGVLSSTTKSNNIKVSVPGYYPGPAQFAKVWLIGLPLRTLLHVLQQCES